MLENVNIKDLAVKTYLLVFFICLTPVIAQ